MIRVTLVWLFVITLSAYAWRDWYKSLCGLILLMAVVQHPDFPNSALGVHGLNPWNILLLNVVLAWMAARGREGLKWDLPPKLMAYVGVFFFIIIIAYLRMVRDLDSINAFAEMRNEPVHGHLWMFSEYIINCFKWVIPGILLYDGCRDDKRFRLAAYTLVGLFFLYALQVVRWMPLSMLTGADSLSERALKIIENEIGFHRVNMAMLLAGGAWAMYTVRELPRNVAGRFLLVLLSGFTVIAMVLTGGRMGIVTWVVLGAAFAFWRWRRLLVIGPVLLLIVLAVVPAARDRLMQGFGGGEIATNSAGEETLYVDEGEPHWYTVTSGRSLAWPRVIEKISERPLAGYGRKAMQNTGLAAELAIQYNETFPHPHNAYLQWMFDNGIPAMIPVLILFYIIIKQSKELFLDGRDTTYVAAGGLCLSLVLAFLFAGIGSQSFYPREGAVGMWCAIGLMWRVAYQRAALLNPAKAPSRRNVVSRIPRRIEPKIPRTT